MKDLRPTSDVKFIVVVLYNSWVLCPEPPLYTTLFTNSVD